MFDIVLDLPVPKARKASFKSVGISIRQKKLAITCYSSRGRNDFEVAFDLSLIAELSKVIKDATLSNKMSALMHRAGQKSQLVE